MVNWTRQWSVKLDDESKVILLIYKSNHKVQLIDFKIIFTPEKIKLTNNH